MQSTMDPFLTRIPEIYRSIYIKNWTTIQPRLKSGIIKDVYHYPLTYSTNNEIVSKLKETLSNYTETIKINLAFGFILRNRTTDELKFFHPSNNTMLFETPKLIQNSDDRRNIEKEIEGDDIISYVRQQRPSTSWILERVICARFDVYKMN